MGLSGAVDVIAWENESFIFKFENLQTKMWVMDRGPWFISQQPLFLRNWKSGPVEKLSSKKVSIWIKLWQIPLELFTPEGIACIASAVGKPLYLDKATAERRRVYFARVCVEVNK